MPQKSIPSHISTYSYLLNVINSYMKALLSLKPFVYRFELMNMILIFGLTF